MAGTFSQHGIYAATEVHQNIKRHKGLHRTGKTTAMDTAGTCSIEQVLTKAKGHILAGNGTCGGHILQIHPGRAAALLHQLQKARKIAVFQRGCLPQDSGVFRIKMNGTQDRPIGAALAQLRKGCVKGLGFDLGQYLSVLLGILFVIIRQIPRKINSILFPYLPLTSIFTFKNAKSLCGIGRTG